MKLILASSSPRRQEILKQMGIDFTVFQPNTDESYPASLSLNKVSEYVAVKKAFSVTEQPEFGKKITHGGFTHILAADTVIIHRKKIYGKPKNIQEAELFLNDFSGKTHTVVSSIALIDCKTQKMSTKTSITKVTFAKLTKQKIERYLSYNEWVDAAGGYKIQEKGALLISNINGSFSGVMGLPIYELGDILIESNCMV